MIAYQSNFGTGFLPKEQLLERPTLTPEEAQEIASHKHPQWTFTLNKEDILKAKCNHQGNPLNPNMPAFSKNNLEQFVCNTCGEVINLNKIYTPEEAEALFGELNNIMNIIKITDRTLPDDVRTQLYQSTALFKKIPEIYKHCSGNFDKIYNSNFVNYTYNGFNDVFGTINNMYTAHAAPSPMGQMNPYGQPQPGYGYPQQPNMMGQQVNPGMQAPGYGYPQQPMNTGMGFTQPTPQQQSIGQMNFGYNPMPSHPAPQPPQYNYVGQVAPGTNLLDPTANVYQAQSSPVPGQAPVLENVSTSGIPGANVTPVVPEIDPNTGKPKATQI